MLVPGDKVRLTCKHDHSTGFHHIGTHGTVVRHAGNCVLVNWVDNPPHDRETWISSECVSLEPETK
jgi:hypothetical protein